MLSGITNIIDARGRANRDAVNKIVDEYIQGNALILLVTSMSGMLDVMCSLVRLAKSLPDNHINTGAARLAREADPEMRRTIGTSTSRRVPLYPLIKDRRLDQARPRPS